MNLRRLSILHLKVYLGCHFKKHKKLQKTVIKKMYLTLQLWFTWGSNRGYTFESIWILCILYILYTAKQTELLTFQIRFHRWSTYAGKRKGRMVGGGGDEGSLGNRVIYWFNGAIFISKCIQGRLGIKKIWLVSAYVLYGWHLCKK